jgi:hypothetical protein
MRRGVSVTLQVRYLYCYKYATCIVTLQVRYLHCYVTSTLPVLLRYVTAFQTRTYRNDVKILDGDYQ